jgi:hypothetical protein
MFNVIEDTSLIAEVEAARVRGGNIALLNNYVEWSDSRPEGSSKLVALMGEGNPCHGRKASSVYSALSNIINSKPELKGNVRIIKREEGTEKSPFTQVYLTRL